MTRLIAASADAMLDAEFVPGTVYYMGLWTTDPGATTNNPTGEVTGGSYARQPITFAAAAAGSKASSGTDAAQNFTGMPLESGGVLYFGICSTVSGSTYMAGGLTSGLSGSIPAASTIAFAASSVVLVLA